MTCILNPTEKYHSLGSFIILLNAILSAFSLIKDVPLLLLALVYIHDLFCKVGIVSAVCLILKISVVQGPDLGLQLVKFGRQ